MISSFRWEYDDLLFLRRRIESYGLRLEAIENVPVWFMDKVILGLPGRDEQIDNYQATIRNLGRAGIRILGYHWMPQQVWRTLPTAVERGTARVTAFDLNSVLDRPFDRIRVMLLGGDHMNRQIAEWEGQVMTHGKAYSEDDMWRSWEYFIKAVLPIAQESGVRLSHHPDDPPVESLGGIARPFRSLEAFKRAEQFTNSKAWGLTFCVGTWSEMASGRGGVLEGIKYFGSRDKIWYVHFRDVKGTVPSFRECFLGDGNCDLLEVLSALSAVNFQGFLMEDHVPLLQGDTIWEARSRCHQLGFIQGMLHVFQHPKLCAR